MDRKPTYEELQQRVKQLDKEAVECRGELEDTAKELALGLSEVSQALKQIASGDPHVRMPETAKLELIAQLKHMVNLTAENLAEMVNLSHEFAIGLAEHFDALHRVSTGDLTARVSGISQVDLLESLKKVTNQMIESVSTEITERQRAEKALRNAHNELEQRVEELADRPMGFKPEGVPVYMRLLPLSEIISSVVGVTYPGAKKVWGIYNVLISRFGDEYSVLIDASKEAMAEVVDREVAEAVVRVREGEVKVVPGYDGVYGQLKIFEKAVGEEASGAKIKQRSLTDFV